ncbi:Protein phosphatase 1L [Armadillidium nasatum]|uniref:Protein phosphatase 1L n=1 Tax=Armadillidium nasatum TaxID=96803 RepID=A0A5N5SJ49_9CRUS|nr:Protein phosphatase 1L [Armadillidium nasatum]
MDDNMEDDIIYELFTIHHHLVWKIFSLAVSNIDSMLPHKADYCKYKWPNLGSLLLVSIVVIVCVILQTRKHWLKNGFEYCCKLFYQRIFVDYNFKNIVSSSSVGSSSFSQELAEGIVGVYALQGRRGTMEDKYSVMQEVDVGGLNKLSLFGVYDGHGGQFVAEYVKQHLFSNTIQKIRELRSTLKGKKSHVLKELTQKAQKSQLNTNNTNQQSDCNTPVQDSSHLSSKELGITSEENSNGTNCENVEDKEKCDSKTKGEEIQNCEAKDNEEVILKKEDPYLNTKLKKGKRASVSVANEAKETESRKETSDDGSYIDVNSNVNYSKLLNDQIMDIDEKVVNFCKKVTDLSGTTAIIAVLDGELLIIGNVGDSRAVMGDLKGSTIPLSFDHKPNQLKERRRIKEAGGFITFTGVWRVAGILATSRALGDFPLKDPRKLITAEPDVLTFSLKDHKAHFVILASDGLWDVMSNEDAVEFVRNHINEWDNGARSLVLHAYDRGSQDNITALIINLSKLSI